MKIEATCDTCSRTFLLSQIGPDAEAPGRCPFCGARFARHYSTVLAESVQGAENAATSFVHILARLQSMETGFDIDIEGLVGEISRQVRGNDSHARPA
ncbi:MAG TPA: hypothetical protein VNP73_10390 [Actinomycetota bacterium]|nr:hypothetical protein [Actinomycetota bacterium]